MTKRQSGRKPKVRRAVAARQGLRRNGKPAHHLPSPEDHELLAAYHRQTSKLEQDLTAAREEVRALKAANEDLLESRRHYTELFRRAPTGYVTHDRAGIIQEINWAAREMLGVKQGEPLPGSLIQFIQREDVDAWSQHMRRSSNQPRSATELNFRSRHGKSMPFQVVTAGVSKTLGRAPRIYRTSLVDASIRRDAEAALAQTQLDYHRLIDTIEGIVWEAKAATMDFTFVSRYAERLLGYPLTEWSRRDFWRHRIYAADRELVANRVARVRAEQQLELVMEYRVVAADRRLVWLHDNVTLIKRHGELRLLGVAIDVSQRRQAEESLRLAHEQLEEHVAERTAKLRETVADLEALSYSLSHDMRSPLRAMQGYAALLADPVREKLGPGPLEFVHRIMRSAERLDGLVQDVLSYGRIAQAPIALKPISLEGLLENILNDFPTLARARNHIEIRRPLLPVYGHEAFVGQVLSNLLTNAIKFMPRGRTPRVRVWTEDLERHDGTLAPHGAHGTRWVRLWVEDNGIGMSAEDQRRVFRIFERIHPVEQYEGTGIGLAIVLKAVERMGGRVDLRSTLGEGSKFWVELRSAKAVESGDVG